MKRMIAMLIVLILAMLQTGSFADKGGCGMTGVNEIKEEEGPTMQMKINDTPVAVAWEENESVAALRELAQNGLTIEMSMYGGFEQVGAIGQRLPSQDVHIDTSSGDIVLYASNQLVVFYGSNSWAYTRLGHIAEEMRALLGSGDVRITMFIQ